MLWRVCAVVLVWPSKPVWSGTADPAAVFVASWLWPLWSVSHDLFHVLGQNINGDFACSAPHYCDILSPQGIPHQKNDSDCGVFVLEVTDSSSLFLLFISLSLISGSSSSPSSVKTPESVCSPSPLSLPASLWMWVTYLLFYLSVSCSQYCRCLSMKQPLHFSQEDMPGIRKRIYKELCDYRLSDWLTPVRGPVCLRSGCIRCLVFQEVQKACLLVWQAEERVLGCPADKLSTELLQSAFPFAVLQRTTDVALYWPTTDAGPRFHPGDQRTQRSVGFYSCTQVGPMGRPFIPSLSGLNCGMAILNWRVFNYCLYSGLCSSLLTVICVVHIGDGKFQWNSWKTVTKTG